MASAYFAYLACVAVIRLKLRPAAVAVAVLLSIWFIGMASVMPVVYLLLGYWLPAMLVRKPNVGFERWLLETDHNLFGREGLARFEREAPRPVIEYLELSYLLCYAVVPAGYLCLWLTGHDGPSIDRFWSIVLLASFLCYGLLPWLPTRAPRALEQAGGETRSAIKRINLMVLNRASVQWNTFPSGHTAASLATAFAVGSHMPAAGLVLGAIALSIAAGSVAGRYHYVADALAGALVAVLAFAIW